MSPHTVNSPHTVRVLTVTDLHQHRALYDQLTEAVLRHRPTAVTFVGDVLEATEFAPAHHLTVEECAGRLAALPAEELLFTRGNHEYDNWTPFVSAWPHAQRPLVGLYGTNCSIGPLQIVGFPCHMGSEFSWCSHLSADGNEMELAPERSREELPYESDKWLPTFLRRLGPAGRTLWLMHEPPMGRPLAAAHWNQEWGKAVERHQPKLTISGHDHQTPIRCSRWHEKLGDTICVNVGQTVDQLHYCVLEFEFPSPKPSLPTRVVVTAFPHQQTIVL